MATETPYFNYINSLYDLLQVNPINPNTQLLYHTLLMIFNRAHWTKELQRTNSYICSLCNFSEKALIKARNELKQLGLIEFKSRKKTPTTYRLTVDFTVNQGVNSSVNRAVIGQVKGQIYKDIRRKTEDIPPIVPRGTSAPYSEIVSLYNDICLNLPKCTTLSDARKKAIHARLKRYGVDDFRKVFEKAQASAFLTGGNNRNWNANFDWLIKDANFAKVLDGNYDDSGLDIYRDTVDHASLEELTRLNG